MDQHRPTIAGDVLADEHFAVADDGFEVGEILARLWRRRWWLFAVTFVALVLGSVFLHLSTPRYTSSLVVTPTDENASHNLASQFGGLASLAGVSLPLGGSSPFSLYAGGVFNRDTAERIAKDPALLHGAFPKEWNASTQQWQQPPSSIRPLVIAVKQVIGVPIVPWTAPDAVRMQEFIARKIKVEEPAKKAIIVLRTEQAQPVYGEALLKAVQQAVDAQLRERALARTEQNIAYLTQKLATVTLAEHRQALANGLAEAERASMAANSTVPFAGEAFGQVSTSRLPTSPQPVLTLLIAAMLGLIIGSVLALAIAENKVLDVAG